MKLRLLLSTALLSMTALSAAGETLRSANADLSREQRLLSRGITHHSDEAIAG
jgi:hypothetical protein